MTKRSGLSKGLSAATVAMTPDLDPQISRGRMKAIVEDTMRDHSAVRLILFGEVILGWFYKKGETREYHESIAEPIPGPTTDFVSALAKTHDIYISFGLTEQAGDKLYNTQVLISPAGEIIAKHRKFWIRNKVFTSMDRQLTTATVDGVKVAILICADGRSMWLRRQIRRAHADIVLASLADYATSSRWNQLIGMLYDSWVLIANRYGEEPPITWHGLITITDPWGRLCASGMSQEQVLVHRLAISQPNAVSRLLRRILVGFRFVGLATLVAAKIAWTALKKKIGS